MGAPRVAGGEGSGGGCPGVRGGGGVGWGGGGGVEGVRARGCVPGVGGECVCVWVGGGMSRGSGLALGGFGTVWSGVGTVPQGRTLGSPRPALGPGRPGPWPPRLPGSRASPSAPVQGHSCPGGTATTGCPACPVLGRTQPTAGSWRALGRAPLGSAREENGGWSAGALARGWRPQPRGWGVGGGGWSGGGGAGWGGGGWGGVGGEPPGMGGGGRARWLSGAGEPGPRAQQGAAPPAQWTRSPAAHPGSRGRVRPGPKPAGRCSVRRWTPRTVPLAGHAITAAPRRGAPQAREKERPGGSRGAPSRMRLPGAG